MVEYSTALGTKITEVNLSVFVYRLFHEDFSPWFRRVERNLHETVCKQMLILLYILFSSQFFCNDCWTFSTSKYGVQMTTIIFKLYIG